MLYIHFIDLRSFDLSRYFDGANQQETDCTILTRITPLVQAINMSVYLNVS